MLAPCHLHDLDINFFPRFYCLLPTKEKWLTVMCAAAVFLSSIVCSTRCPPCRVTLPPAAAGLTDPAISWLTCSSTDWQQNRMADSGNQSCLTGAEDTVSLLVRTLGLSADHITVVGIHMLDVGARHWTLKYTGLIVCKMWLHWFTETAGKDHSSLFLFCETQTQLQLHQM